MPTRKSPRKKSKRVKAKPVEGLDKALLCARAALDKKAEELTVLDISELSSFADYFVICHGASSRQVQAIADNILEKLKKSGVRAMGDEGYTEARWILVDAGDVVAHVFDEPVRRFYNLERLWIHAREVELPEER